MTQQTPQNPQKDPLLKLLELHGVNPSPRHYLTKAAMAVPRFPGRFSVSMLAREAGIPRTKGYRVVGLLEDLGLVRPVPKLPRPRDWGEYSRRRRKRFRARVGLPPRGKEPQMYIYTPGVALARLERRVEALLREMELEAERTRRSILGSLDEVRRSLASRPPGTV